MATEVGTWAGGTAEVEPEVKPATVADGAAIPAGAAGTAGAAGRAGTTTITTGAAGAVVGGSGIGGRTGIPGWGVGVTLITLITLRRTRPMLYPTPVPYRRRRPLRPTGTTALRPRRTTRMCRSARSPGCRSVPLHRAESVKRRFSS